MNKDLSVMAAMEHDALPLQIHDFCNFRKRRMIYVDKTAAIYRLAIRHGHFFISRPRHFGKTLLVSTLESLFKYGLKEFKGLAIEKLWKDHCYPVISINLASCKYFTGLDDFKAQMDHCVAQAFKHAGLILPLTQGDVISRIKDYFDAHEHDDISPVLLVDEYDAPLNGCIDDPELFEDVSRELSRFYTLIEDISSNFRFSFFTGNCIYKHLSLFSDTDYVTDLSLDPDYGTLLGFTEDEIREYFSPFVENATRVLGISSEECFAKLKHHYEGYCFDKKASTHVYTPCSVLPFLRNPEDGFCNYWNETRGNVFLNYIAGQVVPDPFAYDKNIYLTLNNLNFNGTKDERDDYALLYQAGYLTIKETSSSGDVVLNYPNEEVRSSLARLYMRKIFTKKIAFGDRFWGADELFYNSPVKDIPEYLNSTLADIDYQNFPIRDEATLRSSLYFYIKGSGIKVYSELHNSYGRSDLEFDTDSRHFVLELKVVADESKAPSKLEEAIKQIKDKHYGESNANGKELIRIALVYALEKRCFVAHAFV